jgi:microcystin degradation protein MlrC
MRIGIVALLQESNTFIPRPTTLRHFEEELLVTGEEMRRRFDGAHHEIGGMLYALEEEQVEAVPVFAARALPFGRIERAAIEEVLGRMWQALEAAGILNGVLVAPHGATVSEPYPDIDGYWLSELRRRVGQRPIIGTLDPHGNLSPAMVSACDALMAYRTNPHLDQRARGIDAARMIVATLRGQLSPTMAAAFPPMAINIERQCTSEEPCQRLFALADEQLADEQVLSNSIMFGFPYADVAEMGSATIAVTNGDPALARKMADNLARRMWELRHEFAGHLIGLNEALDEAANLEGPVCLLDMGDNVGGGSPGDGTWLAEAILNRKLPRSFVCLYDPESVQAAQAAGTGAKVVLSMGGKTDTLHGPALQSEVTVCGLFDGRFEEKQPRHGGFTQMDQGPTAVVGTDMGLTVMLTSKRMPPFSLRQLTTFGVEPEKYHLLIAKGVNAPIAAYREVCKHYLRVNTRGCTSADLLSLPYHHRRRPMFPFEPETAWAP